ncbi:MAG: cysteine hydrolase [Pseudomonadota bacterium]|nr:cysteine hydrolase [Pseudomonadota bacterium]
MAVGFQTPGNVLCKWGARGAPIARELAPQSDDYFVLKSRHSGFFQTPLDLLLQNLRAKKLILCGLTTDSCVLFTANDGYLRGLEIFVPADCCAALAKRRHTDALGQMRRTLKASTMASILIDYCNRIHSLITKLKLDNHPENDRKQC